MGMEQCHVAEIEMLTDCQSEKLGMVTQAGNSSISNMEEGE